jgi:hypothetical protein
MVSKVLSYSSWYKGTFSKVAKVHTFFKSQKKIEY